jgi:hypothetical protein
LTTTSSHLEITFTVTNPISAASSVSAGNPIAPATYLQLSFDFGGDIVVFPEEAMFTPRDIVPALNGEEGEMTIRMERTGVPKKGTLKPEVKIHGWKGEKILGSWEVGRVGGETEVAVR